MRYTWIILSAAVLSLGATPSIASKASADACAAKLSLEAKQVYAASIGSVAPGVDMREVVRGKTAKPGRVAPGECKRGKHPSSTRLFGDPWKHLRRDTRQTP